MRMPAMFVFCAALLANAPALAQERPGREVQLHKRGLQQRDRVPDERRQIRQGRLARGEGERGARFSRAEREQLRQDLLDANREMKRRR